MGWGADGDLRVRYLLFKDIVIYFIDIRDKIILFVFYNEGRLIGGFIY